MQVLVPAWLSIPTGKHAPSPPLFYLFSHANLTVATCQCTCTCLVDHPCHIFCIDYLDLLMNNRSCSNFVIASLCCLLLINWRLISLCLVTDEQAGTGQSADAAELLHSAVRPDLADGVTLPPVRRLHVASGSDAEATTPAGAAGRRATVDAASPAGAAGRNATVAAAPPDAADSGLLLSRSFASAQLQAPAAAAAAAASSFASSTASQHNRCAFFASLVLCLRHKLLRKFHTFTTRY